MKYVKDKRLEPLIKWTGGKTSELKYIHSFLPEKFNNFYEPFVGGGSVFLSLDINHYFINDKSKELVDLYQVIQEEHSFIKFLDYSQLILNDWYKINKFITKNKSKIVSFVSPFLEDKEILKSDIDTFFEEHEEFFVSFFENSLFLGTKNVFLIEVKKNLFQKIKRMSKINKEKEPFNSEGIFDNIESALKSAFYMYIRHLYNLKENFSNDRELNSFIYFFIRNFSYSGMFRYNKNGDFNVPYGGIGYNNKNIQKKLDYYSSKDFREHLLKTSIFNFDFEEFFNITKPSKNDFIFLDPPYDSTFSTYDKNIFSREDQTRLRDFLVDRAEANWLMIISNTDFIYDLYNVEGIYIYSFDKKYSVNFKNRFDNSVKHLVISNYEIDTKGLCQ